MANQNLFDLLKDALRMYWNNVGTLLGISFLLYYLPSVIVQIVQVSLLGVANATLDMGSLGLGAALSALAAVVLGVLLLWVLSTLLSVSIIRAAPSLLKGKRHGLRELVRGGIPYLGKGLGLSILAGIFLVGLFLLLIVPGIIFSIFWIFILYILVLEDTRVMETFKRSRDLVRGRWWKTLGYAIVIALVIGIIALLAMTPFLIAGFVMAEANEYAASIFQIVTTEVVSTVLAPLSILFFARVYLNWSGKDKKPKKKTRKRSKKSSSRAKKKK